MYWLPVRDTRRHELSEDVMGYLLQIPDAMKMYWLPVRDTRRHEYAVVNCYRYPAP